MIDGTEMMNFDINFEVQNVYSFVTTNIRGELLTFSKNNKTPF